MKRVLKVLLIFLVIIIIILLYSRFIGTKGLIIKEYKVNNSLITSEYHGLKIVHISDIHYGSTIFEKQLQNLVSRVNELKPDIVVFTGDLFTNKKKYDKDIIIDSLKTLEVRLGKYYITGNHDYPNEEYQEILNNSGFINLDDTYDLIYDNSNKPILISGISSCLKDCDVAMKTDKFDHYFATLSEIYYSILLLHEPDNVDKLDLSHYNLILAGHSHGGQVRLPLIGKVFTPNGSKKYYDEHYTIDNTELYISSGIGNSGMNLRLFNKPSINLYRLTSY